ncbi:hypothetical protein SAY86_015842 [Trapa natans]|uniref:Uncharacterized protein n=1 Tax=Trapa natans TaxID=22666 RepID=A0AAN7LB76_TRANT|nr:hypothetical protein SAY86_015842 [Trapa natans]
MPYLHSACCLHFLPEVCSVDWLPGNQGLHPGDLLFLSSLLLLLWFVHHFLSYDSHCVFTLAGITEVAATFPGFGHPVPRSNSRLDLPTKFELPVDFEWRQSKCSGGSFSSSRRSSASVAAHGATPSLQNQTIPFD